MNVLESTDFFVRVIIFDFINRDTAIKLRFRLVPMIHIGNEEYYQKAFDHLNECDEVLYEGIQLKESQVITNRYKGVAKQLDLVLQRDYLHLNELRAKLIHADLSQESGKKEWEKLKLKEKIKMSFITPARIYYQYWGMTRKKFAKSMMTSAQEQYLAYGAIEDEPGTVDNLIMHVREQIIFQIIDKKLTLEANEDKLIGIVYGAAHMKAICRYLIDKFHFVPREAKFLKVFDV